MDTYRRSQSHSKFADEFPSLDRTHRSKSLDTRREFVAPQSYDYYHERDYSPSKRPYFERQNEREPFFNDSITIPIQPIQKQQQPVRHHQSARDLYTSDAAEDNEWTSYDRSVKYNHQRTEYPPARQYQQQQQQQQQQQYYDYSTTARRGIQQAGPPPRYPESDYTAQNSYRRHADFARSSEAASGYRTAGRAMAHDQSRQYDDELVSGGTFGRGAGARDNARYQYQHSSRHHASSGGGHHINGYASGTHKRNASAGGATSRSGGGGFFGRSREHKAYAEQQQQYHGGPSKPTAHHKVRCCCLSFMWPPWGYEQCEPPRPMFYQVPPSPLPPPMQHHQGMPPPLGTSSLPPPHLTAPANAGQPPANPPAIIY